MEESKQKKKKVFKILFIIFFVILAAAIIGFGNLFYSHVGPSQMGRTTYIYSQELEQQLFPFDPEEAERIEQSQLYGDGETWAIYMYLNASNLEIDGYSQLSNFVEYVAKEQSNARIAGEKAHSKELFADFIRTGEEHQIPLPVSLYDANYNKGAVSLVPEEQHTVSEYGWGTSLLNAFRKAEFPDNVTFVVQPGGAKAWKDPQINPNRNRRYVKKGQELVEVYDAPVTSMGESETLADFLRFCKKNYPADHTMVILTDHGGAMTGFGWDNIYDDDNLTLKELREAFDMAYGLDEKNPPIDLLYFNACLMSNSDVLHAMRGTCRYMIAGEEVGLSMSDYYIKVADALMESPSMNAMQLGKAVIDAYSRDLAEYGWKFGAPPTTGLCLLDMQKAPLVYYAYAELAEKVLGDVAGNPRILGRLSRAVQESISFAVDSYKQYNTTDLGLWVNEIRDLYPQQAEKIISLIDDAVIYKRVDSYLKDAHGVSVYYPNYVEDLASLSVALKYIDLISESQDISALYYYKLAGCMNEKYTAYCQEKGIQVPDPIDYGAMQVLRNSVITATDDGGNVKASIDQVVYPILTDARFELSKVNEAGDMVTCYGEDRFVDSDGANGIQTVFEGKWVSIGGTPLMVNVINTYDDIIIYESPVEYKGYPYKLILQCEINEESGEDTFTVLGLRHPTDGAATIDRDVTPLTVGSYITPVYYESAAVGGRMTRTEGKSIPYTANTKVQDEPLEKGTYRVRIVYENMRGEDVFSAPVFFEVK